MEELWEGWDDILDTSDCYHLFNEHDKAFDENLKEDNNSKDSAELSWENLHSYSCVTKESTTLLRNSLSFEDIIDFDVSSLNQQDNASPQKSNQQDNASPQKPKSCILSFEDSTTVQCQHQGEHSKENQEKPHNSKPTKPLKRTRSSSQTLDHIIAERKRRENITRMLISLSALIPGLKKMDKASVLNSAVEYVKDLQQRVKDLEQENKKRKIESAGYFKMNKINNVADEVLSSPSDDNPIKICPEVEARVLGKDVLIIVLCEKQKNIVRKFLAMLVAHNLSIVCSNVLPFGNSSLNFTCIAKIDSQFSTTMDKLVKMLTEDLLKCCNLQQ